MTPSDSYFLRLLWLTCGKWSKSSETRERPITVLPESGWQPGQSRSSEDAGKLTIWTPICEVAQSQDANELSL